MTLSFFVSVSLAVQSSGGKLEAGTLYPWERCNKNSKVIQDFSSTPAAGACQRDRLRFIFDRPKLIGFVRLLVPRPRADTHAAYREHHGHLH
jgi:hypothetical protein